MEAPSLCKNKALEERKRKRERMCVCGGGQEQDCALAIIPGLCEANTVTSHAVCYSPHFP